MIITPVGYIYGPHVGPPLSADQQDRMKVMEADGRRLVTAEWLHLFAVLGTVYGGPRWRRRLPRRVARRMERHPLTRPRWFHVPDMRGCLGLSMPLPRGVEPVDPAEPPDSHLIGRGYIVHSPVDVDVAALMDVARRADERVRKLPPDGPDVSG